MPKNAKLRNMLLPLVLSATILSACVACERNSAPTPIIPDDCTLDWFATQDKAGQVPACVVGWFDRYTKQQETVLGK